MTADEFLKKYGSEKSAAVAEAAGTNLAYFKQIAKGIRYPSAKLAHRLVDASGMELGFSALLARSAA
jgi:hypothetical protein